MEHETYSDYWYSNELPKLLDKLKVNLTKYNKKILTYEDYLNVILEFYEKYNGFKYFEKDLVESDQLCISANFKFGLSELSFMRTFCLNSDFDDEFVHESYQINLILYLNIKYTHESFEESFQIERDKENNLSYKINSYWQSSDNKGEEINNFENFSGLTNISAFRQKIINNKNVNKYLVSKPDFMCLYLNADI
jgi:hypothetical protein